MRNYGRLLAGLLMLGATGSVVLAAQSPPKQAAAMLGQGYLAPSDLPDSLLLLPPPPERGSPAEARDIAAAAAAVALQGSARWTLAGRDADLFSDRATAAMSCAAGRSIGPKTTPRLNALMRKVIPDLGLATYAAKTKYQRTRPFVVNGAANCTPQQSAKLATDGSYPSGHSAIGYGWGLILAEVMPDRATALVQRGREFADSRRICNVHWLSDVEAGEVIGAAVVAQLHADRTFRKDLDAVRKELASTAPLPAEDCVPNAATR